MALNISAIDGLQFATLSHDLIASAIDQIESKGGLIVSADLLFEGKHKIGWWNGQDSLTIDKYQLEELIKLLSQNGIRIAQGIPSGATRLRIKLEKMTRYTPLTYKTASFGETLYEGENKGKRTSRNGYSLL
ncbi:hypothetical protein [Estrella lausannensis]|uniref:Uncharacterized protein n=1 Tax=Estrella lausannensis TaxID=483423 RepID=A0A0H5DN86_9BACT|nr:hypothetical protein [Estrella lausannensis]CRX37741.1 hypothetical protein ELAC_0380 [Estrella lausannensis]